VEITRATELGGFVVVAETDLHAPPDGLRGAVESSQALHLE